MENNIKLPPADAIDKKLLEIIKAVNSYDKQNNIKRLFTKGFCYDFAIMLWRSTKNCRMFYDNKRRHYLTEYRGRYYDITGEVPNVNIVDLTEDDYQIRDESFNAKHRTHM